MFPKYCLGCGKAGGYVCGDCEVGMWEEEQICPACGRASRYGAKHLGCKGILAGLSCFWAYEGLVKKLIGFGKYRYYFDVFGEVVERSGRVIGRTEFEYLRRFVDEGPAVVPVPLSKKREKWRGFNQAEILAEKLAKLLKLEKKNWLERIVDTGQQVGRSRKDRWEATKECFGIERGIKVQGKVLLVDDVWTTGATMQSAAKVLKEAGVEAVWGLVMAR